VAAECDLTVLNGGHASTVEFLLAGKPILQVPVFLEQAINSQNTARLGAGMIGFPRGEDRTAQQLHELLANPVYTQAARDFAARYAAFSACTEISQAVDRLNELAGVGSFCQSGPVYVRW
jgi:UDP:flavonoid glycosyltransferase YjiC (YdhE family)